MGTSEMEFLQLSSLICFMVAVASLIIAVVFFFLFDIRNIFLIETGRARSKAIRAINERNNRSERMRDKSGMMSGSRAKTPSRYAIWNGFFASCYQSSEGTVNSNGTESLDFTEDERREGFTVTQRTIVTHTDECAGDRR